MRYDAPKHLFVNIIYLYKLDVAVESRAISGYSTTSISYERKGRPGNIYMLLRDIPRLTLLQTTHSRVPGYMDPTDKGHVVIWIALSPNAIHFIEASFSI